DASGQRLLTRGTARSGSAPVGQNCNKALPLPGWVCAGSAGQPALQQRNRGDGNTSRGSHGADIGRSAHTAQVTLTINGWLDHRFAAFARTRETAPGSAGVLRLPPTAASGLLGG